MIQPLPKSTTNIRLAEPRDAAGLSKLCRDTFIEAFERFYDPKDFNDYMDSVYRPELQLKEILDGKSYMLVVEVDGELAAYAKCGVCKLPVTPEQKAFEVHRIYVLEKFHRLGIGRKLMEVCENEAARQGVKEVYLGVWQENKKAQSFYRSLGYREIASYIFMVGSQADREFIMYKPIC